MFYYGMSHRGCSPGSQPKEGLAHFVDTDKRATGFYSIVVYNRKLSKNECDNYELRPLNEASAKTLLFKKTKGRVDEPER